MKKILRLSAIILALATLLCCFSSCAKNKSVISLENKYYLSEDIFECILIYCKTQKYAEIMTLAEESGEDTSAIETQLKLYDTWNLEAGSEGKTIAQTVKEEAVVVAKGFLSASKWFDVLDMTLTKDDYTAIDDAISELDGSFQSSYGVTLENKLSDCGLTLNTFREFQIYQYKASMVLARLTSPGATYEVTDEMVAAKYDETVEEEGYSNVNHIFLASYTNNSTGIAEKISDELYESNKELAEKIYESITSGETEFEEWLSYSNDKYSPDGYLVCYSSPMTDVFIKNAITMEIGEIRFFESEDIGFHIMKKYALTEENKTEIEDTIRENLEDEMEDKIYDKYYDSITVNDDKIAEFDAAKAELLV